MSIVSRYIGCSALAVASVVTAAPAFAQTKIMINMLTADSVQKFSDDAIFSFESSGLVVTPKGNALQKADGVHFPITDITLGASKYAGLAPATVKGSSSGSALEIWTYDELTGNKIGLTLANFQIDYHAKKVLADVTPIGGGTSKATPLYDYVVKRPLVFQQVPGKILLQEVLGTLKLTPLMQDTFTRVLHLPDYASVLLPVIDFGTLTQTIDLTLRSTANAAPYVPAP